MGTVDKVIIGAGLYGLYAALRCARMGQRVAVLHSGLSMSQRLDEWKRAKRGLVGVVVGTRSAVFAPCPGWG